MNQNNYASREAAQRLVDAGIVLETEKSWDITQNGWLLGINTELGARPGYHYPAPSLAELIRELPSTGELLDMLFKYLPVFYN